MSPQTLYILASLVAVGYASESETSNYQQYIYGGDYQKYMSEHTGDPESGDYSSAGWNYEQYMSQYAGDYTGFMTKSVGESVHQHAEDDKISHSHAKAKPKDDKDDKISQLQAQLQQLKQGQAEVLVASNNGHEDDGLLSNSMLFFASAGIGSSVVGYVVLRQRRSASEEAESTAFHIMA
eukprot:gnl/TRDRNA2_/TRDRNA2_174027_c0_seq1.p1 gnl/TRDRNA2_/TRDRNA2_174027_c0~~gnl/TRDRNA2_/TRDRNA2_174027_c0_seq1.p1  ORF type:complete len:180 (+),score=34.53 gnl/TRDRNA2_/TRDRNA2_174027_c0_seq1:90-629(+)